MTDDANGSTVTAQASVTVLSNCIVTRRTVFKDIDQEPWKVVLAQKRQSHSVHRRLLYHSLDIRRFRTT